MAADLWRAMSDPAIVDLIVLALVLDSGPIHEGEYEDEDDVRIWLVHRGCRQQTTLNPEI